MNLIKSAFSSEQSCTHKCGGILYGQPCCKMYGSFCISVSFHIKHDVTHNFFHPHTKQKQNKIHSSSGCTLLVLTDARDMKSIPQVNSEHKLPKDALHSKKD